MFRCTSKKVRNKALSDDLNLDALLKEARCQETGREIEKGLGNEEKEEKEMFRVSKQPGRYSSKSTFFDNKQFQQQKPQDDTSISNRSNFRRNTQGDPPPRHPHRQFRGRLPTENTLFIVQLHFAAILDRFLVIKTLEELKKF